MPSCQDTDIIVFVKYHMINGGTNIDAGVDLGIGFIWFRFLVTEGLHR